MSFRCLSIEFVSCTYRIFIAYILVGIEDQLWKVILSVCFLILLRLWRIFAETILWSEDTPVAVTDLFPLANQWPRQAIRSHTDQSETERIDSFFLSRTIFYTFLEVTTSLRVPS